ncbi:cupin domain-containing protein [Haladaptatus salinisoli]|uniref:cupin domain-containing protein n=1 Tax=Haladaptatus salinisoli TaxID=2884876 RepID=UPI001D0B4E1F|nr:cupin domain-containing protein [Haladaptatus salinisoli]
MKKVAIDDVESNAAGNDGDRRKLSEPLGTTGVALNHYRLPPGERLPGGLHAHADQEEVFVVVEGEATFETYAPRSGDSANDVSSGEGGEVTVGAGEAIRFAPGEFQSGGNESDDELVVLALGAPRDSEDVRIPVDCPECAHDGVRLETGDAVPAFVCPNCGAERVPQGCPECGRELRVTIGETGTVVVCSDCGAAFEKPPLAE